MAARTTSPKQAETLLDLTPTDLREIIADEVSKQVSPRPQIALATTATDTKSITLHDRHRVALESLFGGPIFDTGDDVVSYASRLVQFSLISPDPDKYEPITIALPLDTLERLDSRRPLDTSLSDMLVPAVLDFIERFINGDV